MILTYLWNFKKGAPDEARFSVAVAGRLKDLWSLEQSS
jgi:hypothetical protein